jgi:flagellar protein FliL
MAEPAAKLDEADEASVAEGDAEGAPAKRRWSGKRLALLIGIPLLLAGAAAGVYFSGLLGGGGSKEQAASEPAKKPAPTESVYLDLPEILVNLEPTGKQQRFLKTQISLEVGSNQDADALKKVLPRLIDQFQTYLRGLRVDDLHGSAGVYRLRQELLARFAEVAQPVEVRDVLFRELLVQ